MSTGSPDVRVTDVRHIHVCGTRKTYCGHPRQGGISNFGDSRFIGGSSFRVETLSDRGVTTYTQ